MKIDHDNDPKYLGITILFFNKHLETLSFYF